MQISKYFFQPYFSKIKKFVSKNKLFLAIISSYFFTRLTNLTILPIFNDESIYLHWGWIATQNKNELYYSLFDGKQPLLMWVFGYMQLYFSDPLVAGRLVSVFTGFLSLLGIYRLSIFLFNRSTALLASLFYVLCPIFIFYDRQSLMESSIACVGIWSCFLFLKNLSRPAFLTALGLGIILGVGIFIKSTPVIFLLVFIILSLYLLYKSNNTNYKDAYLMSSVLIIFVSQWILLPLYKQPFFYNIISMNSRYSFALSDLSYSLFLSWARNVMTTFDLLFWFITPFFCIHLFIGLYILLKSKLVKQKYFIAWFILTLFSFILLTRNPSIRYLVAFLPIASIILSVSIVTFIKKKKALQFHYLLLCASIGVILMLDTFLLFSPLNFISLMSKVTYGRNLAEYANTFTSGYGVTEAKDYLQDISKQKKIHVFLRSDSGNPENAMFVYLKNNPQISIQWLNFSCANGTVGNAVPHPAYFVTRDSNREFLDDCVSLVRKYNKPDKKNSVSIYQIK